MLRIFFDLDETIFTIAHDSNPELVRRYFEFPHLLHCPWQVDGYHIFFIFYHKTKQLFHYLLKFKTKVEINFITHGHYIKSSMVQLLEEAFELQTGALGGCAFINADDFMTGRSLLLTKAEKFRFLLQSKAHFQSGDEILLIDNLQINCDQCIAFGYDAVLADGFNNFDFVTGRADIHSEYFNQIRVKVADYLERKHPTVQQTSKIRCCIC